MANDKTWVAVCDFRTGNYSYKAGDVVADVVAAHLNNFPDSVRDSHIKPQGTAPAKPAGGKE